MIRRNRRERRRVVLVRKQAETRWASHVRPSAAVPVLNRIRSRQIDASVIVEPIDVDRGNRFVRAKRVLHPLRRARIIPVAVHRMTAIVRARRRIAVVQARQALPRGDEGSRRRRLRRDVRRTRASAHQRADFRSAKRSAVNAEVVYRTVEVSIAGELRSADPVVRRGAEAGRIQRHARVRRYLHAVHVQSARRTGNRDCDVLPYARRESGRRVDLLLGSVAAVRDREAETRAARLRRQEHIVRRAGTDIENARPVA